MAITLDVQAAAVFLLLAGCYEHFQMSSRTLPAVIGHFILMFIKKFEIKC